MPLFEIVGVTFRLDNVAPHWQRLSEHREEVDVDFSTMEE